MAKDDCIVIGAGLAGLAAAWALHDKGCRVRVLDSREGVAMETSYANAGMLTPSMADPWNAPGVWKKLLSWLGREQAPMLLRPAALPSYWRWGLRFLRHSAKARHAAATRANYTLAAYSLAQFQQLRETLNLDYDLRTRGTMQVFRDPAEYATACRHARDLRSQGLQARSLGPAEIPAVEPLLEPVASGLAGAVHFPDDETGDAHRFCQALASHLQQQGVAFEFQNRVQALRVENGRIRALQTADGMRDVSQLVLGCGAWTPGLLAPLGLRMPVRPVKGYSLTVPVTNTDALPGLSIIDQHYHAALTPFDRRIRLAGTAEFAGFDASLRPGRIDMLWQLLERLLPGQQTRLDVEAAEPWCGFRPMSADGLPFIGPTPVAGLSVIGGHGHLGWTQSLGSGRLLADLCTGETAAIDPQPYRFNR